MCHCDCEINAFNVVKEEGKLIVIRKGKTKVSFALQKCLGPKNSDFPITPILSNFREHY